MLEYQGSDGLKRSISVRPERIVVVEDTGSQTPRIVSVEVPQEDWSELGELRVDR